MAPTWAGPGLFILVSVVWFFNFSSWENAFYEPKRLHQWVSLPLQLRIKNFGYDITLRFLIGAFSLKEKRPTIAVTSFFVR